MLETIPEVILLNIVSFLGGKEPTIEVTLSQLPLVCRTWSGIFSSNNSQFWTNLVEISFFGGEIFRPQQQHKRRKRRKRRRLLNTRMRSNPKRFFFQRLKELKEAKRLEDDTIIWDLWKRLRKTDCVSHIKRKLLLLESQQQNQSSTNNNNNTIIHHQSSIVHHHVQGLENRNLLMLACWWGRTRVVQMLVDEPYNASIYVVDDQNASPLLIAAWAGHEAVVKVLLSKLFQKDQYCNKKYSSTTNASSNQKSNNKPSIIEHRQVKDYLNLQGMPPLTSSCGGRGRKVALCWAERKGFQNIVQLLKEADAKASTTTCTTP